MSDKDILSDAKEAFDLAFEREVENRRDALDDLRFARLDEQWPEVLRRARQMQGRPCYTYNKLPAFIRQVVNDARQNQPAIKIHPADSSADPITAQVYNGLIRNIEVTSRADQAYDTALDFAVTMGFGYFRVNTEYATDDTFDLDIVIRRIANPFSVYGDPYSTESDSSDWNSCFVTELIDRDLFKRKYKGAEQADWDANGEYENLKDPWGEDKRILLAEYFTRDEVTKTILLLSDQTVADEEVYVKNKDAYDQAGVTVVSERATRGYRVTQRIMTGAEVLETNKWAGKFIPVIPVYGEELNVEGKRYFRGMVRPMKDAQRNFNFWRTATSELVALAPKAPFIGPKGAFETDAVKWATANVENHSYIEYDGEVAPSRQGFAGVPAGALQEALNANDDMKAIAGLFNASLGAQGNEQSGRAIMARQREGDVSSFHFIDNLSRAIEHCGRIMVDLIPTAYTAPRMLRVLGPDGMPQNVPLGQPVSVQQQNGSVISHVFDLARGKYDLTVETGPSFTTRREEAANQMIEVIRAFPASAMILAPMLAKNLDWDGAQDVAQAFQNMAQQQQAQAMAKAQGAGKPAAPGNPNAGQIDPKTALEAQQVANAQAIDQGHLGVEAFRAQTERFKVINDTRISRLARHAGVF